jgi:hypothetical protein
MQPPPFNAEAEASALLAAAFAIDEVAASSMAGDSTVGRSQQQGRPPVAAQAPRAPLKAPSSAPWSTSAGRTSRPRSLSDGDLNNAPTRVATVMADAPSLVASPLLRDPEFVMYTYKIARCRLRSTHDWATCPYSHYSELGRRRDPRLVPYAPMRCPEMRRCGVCPRLDDCPLSHNMLESWLHPLRYRTLRCDVGAECGRTLCFFAHGEEELRRDPSVDSDVASGGDSVQAQTATLTTMQDLLLLLTMQLSLGSR